jgi:hypothetical protein
MFYSSGRFTANLLGSDVDPKLVVKIQDPAKRSRFGWNQSCNAARIVYLIVPSLPNKEYFYHGI